MTDRTILAATVVLAMAALSAGCDNNVDPPPSDGSTSGSTTDSTASDDSSTSTEDRLWENSGGDDGTSVGDSGETGLEPLVDVKLETVDKAGYQAVIKSHKGKVILVDFWGTWCSSCLIGFPHTLEIAKKYRDDGLQVISLAIEYDADLGQIGAKKFLKDSRATVTQNLISSEADNEQSFENFDLPGEALPQYHLFDRDGKRIKVFNADDNDDPKKAWTHDDIEAAVRAALGLAKE